MNPLTIVKRTQKMNSTEAALGISEEASWHAKYKDSAYIFIGGVPYDLTEGDLLAVFAQYGEVVDVNLIRDKATGKSKGFAFLAYEDQRSTVLAVDNLNGAKVLGRIVRVDHCSKYKKKEEEDEEEAQKKREARGVCRAFQKGECTRGASCKFSHDEQRTANTGWGEQDKDSKWPNDKYAGPPKGHKNFPDAKTNDRDPNFKRSDKDTRSSRLEKGNDGYRRSNDDDRYRTERTSSRRSESIQEDYRDTRTRDKYSERLRPEYSDRDRSGDEKRSRHAEHSSSSRHY